MNIAVFLDEVMPINGPLMFIPQSHKQGVLAAGHDLATTSYPLWTLDHATVTRLAEQGGIVAPTGKPGWRADVPRQPGARLGAEHHALSAPDRLSDAVRGLQPHPQAHPAGWIAHRDFTPIEPVRRRRAAAITRAAWQQGRGGIAMNLHRLLRSARAAPGGRSGSG